jgi:hypothetical protein
MENPTIINTPPSSDNSSGTNTVLLVVIILIIAGLAFWWFKYRAPADNNNGDIKVDVNLPGGSNDNTSGNTP